MVSFAYFLHWVISLTNYENGVAMVNRLTTNGFDPYRLYQKYVVYGLQPLECCDHGFESH
jgi:hypothetical protein